MKKIALLLIIAVTFISCGNDDDATPDPILGCTDESSLNYDSSATQDDGSCSYSLNLTINFKQDWDGTNVTSEDFGTTEYTNLNGEVLKITKLRYLISKVILHSDEAEDLEIEGYNLIDISDNNTLSVVRDAEIADVTYNSISFVYGFNEEDNVDAAYPDLNTASWNWPSMLGGGYHFMQLEGNFINSNSDQQTYAYHNGTARVSEGVFEQNFITVTVDNLTITRDTELSINMNIAEWFKNPNTWDLNIYNSALMGNYEAQILMNENGQSVFSVSVE